MMHPVSRAYKGPVILGCISIGILFLMFNMTQLRDGSNSSKYKQSDRSGFSFDTLNEDSIQRLSVQETVLNMTEVESLSTAYDIAITHPPLKWTEQDLTFFKSAAGEVVFSQISVIPESHTPPNFNAMTSAERLFKALFFHFDKVLAFNSTTPVATDPQHKDSWAFYKRLEASLFPWIYPYWENAFHITNQTSGRGIVLCVGNDQFKYAATTVRSIREVFESDIPIEIFFIRENDLNKAKRTYFLTEFNNISLMKLDSYVSDYYTRFGGWAMKPFAMLASKFTEMIMMDADVYFLQNPEQLFDDPAYAMTGTLFFYDRTLFPDWEKGADWMRSFLPTMSSLVPTTRWFKGTSSHEQESGVVVMNKKKNLMGLLSTCKMNGITERDEVVYKHIHGDKETFWIGQEIMQSPYAFVKSYGAVIGGMGRGDDDGEPTQVCGNQLHLDANHIPLWLNGGLYRDKNTQGQLEYLNFTHYAQGEDWEFSTSCIREEDMISRLDPEQRAVILESVEIDKQRVKDQELLDRGQWKPRSHGDEQ